MTKKYITTSEDIFASYFEPALDSDHVLAYYDYINACPSCGSPASNQSGGKLHCVHCDVSW